MVSWITALSIAVFLAASSASCFGQTADDYPDSALTREQWQQRLEDARRRSEEFVANARARTVEPPQHDEKAAEAAERAMNDPTLQRGDIIATSKGFLVFMGRVEEHRPDDFKPAPNPPSPP
jgi:hypothetical protein